MTNPHTCPVCGYSGDQEFEPRDYQICGCCGTEFGYDDDFGVTFQELRDRWVANGCPWFDPEENQDEALKAAIEDMRAGRIRSLADGDAEIQRRRETNS